MEQVKRFHMPLIIGAGAVVFAVVLFMALVSPQSHKLSSLHAQEGQFQSQQAHLQAQIAELQTDKAHMASNCASLGTALAEIPGTPDVSGFLQQVTALAVATGNPNTPSISVLQAPASSATSGATPVQVSLTLQGDYGQMEAFIKGLNSFPRLFTVTSISVTGGAIAAGGGAVDPATTGYNLQLTGAIYYSLGRQNLCQNTTTAAT